MPDPTASPPPPSFLERGRGAAAKYLAGFGPSEEVVLISTALLVGLGTGLGAIILHFLLEWVQEFSFSVLPEITRRWGLAYVLIAPALGGLIAGPLIERYAKEARGHGVPEVMKAIALHGGRIQPRVAFVKVIASALTIGSGGSAGREGPIVQIGAALGSTVGQWFRLSEDRIRNLVACGAAGGIAAAFNAPIAGVIFALEVILGEFSVGYFSTVVIAAVSAAVVGQAFFGGDPAFSIPVQYDIQSLWEFAFYPALGLLAAIMGVVFVKVLYWTEDFFEDAKALPDWIKPAIGGFLLGGLALAYPLITGVAWHGVPQVFGAGSLAIEATLAGSLPLTAVLVLLVAKLLATSLTLGSGGSGGIFAPTLFIGGMLGAAFGIVLNSLFPGVPAPPGAYALVGRGAVFAAAAHAPITAVIILFELTGDYRIILPLMLTVVLATVISRRMLKGESVYTLKLTRRGIRIQRGLVVDVLDRVSVSEVMVTDVESVRPDLTLEVFSRVVLASHQNGFPVLDEAGRLLGIVTISDMERAADRKLPPDTTVLDFGTPGAAVVTAYPDERIGAVLSRMARRGLSRMPVVDRQNPAFMVGYIRHADLIRAYNLALSRRSQVEQHIKEMGVQPGDDTLFVEVRLREHDPAVGQNVSAVAGKLPYDCLLVAIQRDGALLFPHGHTLFLPGDEVVAFVRASEEKALEACLRGQL